MRFLPCLLLFGYLVADGLAIWKLNTTKVNDIGTYLPIPSYDPWYTAPEGWKAAEPGAILRMRQHAYNMTTLPIANAVDTFQVLFRSTDSHQNATWAVTTVFVPAQRCNSTGADTGNCTLGILSYQLPYDTSCPDASPSFGLQFGEPYGEMAVALKRGWWVSVPDYEGPLGSYGANIVGGYITVDATRAVVEAARRLGFNDTRVALWGYSNGASATEVAVEFAAKYAPELKIAGAAIGGLTSKSTNAGPLLTRTQVSGLLVHGIIGITSQYPELREYVVSRMKPSGPYNQTEFFWARYMSGWQSLLYFSYVDIFEYFVGGEADLETPEMFNMFIREGTLGVFGMPNMPLFLYHAVQDDMTPVVDTDELVTKYCDQGANILFHRNSKGGHNDELTNGRQRAFDFLGDILDGSNVISFPSTGCRTVNLTFEQDPRQPFV
ncbi:lipase 1 [Xylaria palmicola]|nr:lipase 1 [Xylaria palmicola]